MYQPIANSGQNAANAMKRYANDDACCDQYPTACQYDLTIATSATVNNIKFKRTAEGDTITKTFTAVGGTAVVDAIKAALVAEGYEEDSDEVRGVTSAVVSSNTVYSVTGSLIVVSMTHTTSTVVTPTVKCDRVGICDYSIDIPGGATNTFTVDGVDAALGSLTLAGNTAANVKAAIDGAANFPAGFVSTVVETATAFEINLNGPGNRVIVWNGEKLAKQNCVAAYIA